MLTALRAISITVADLEAARDWYSEALEVEPYLIEPNSVVFFLSGCRLILQTLPQPKSALSGDLALAIGTVAQTAPVPFWQTDALQAEAARLLAIGARFDGPATLVDASTRCLTLLDPFGNAFGLIEVDDVDTKAKDQRIAEKVALRQVRTKLDELSQEEIQRKRFLRITAALVIIAVVIALLVLSQIGSRKIQGANTLRPVLINTK
jgi:catechol 2,3-dioxygenase-like lactoylglutathione lyase family enzyme